MLEPIILASTSRARMAMLDQVRISYRAIKPAIDEQSVKLSLLAEGLAADEIADALADAKARKISGKHPDSIVIGGDQILSMGGTLLSKPKDPGEAFNQLISLRKKTHILYSSSVIYQGAKPLWRATKPCRMRMRDFSENYARAYVDRNWSEIRHCVGCYQIEAEGARLFAQIEGDQFSIMGLPLLDVVSYLASIGAIEK